MLRRQRPGGGRHPPPLAPTVSNFKPRAQWNNSGSSIILYVNLPGFYRDQIEIKKDVSTQTIYIQGQRPLSTQTKARFNEVYRVPDSFDMTKLNTSFIHGLLTMEFPTVVEGEKTEKVGNDQGKTDNEENRETGLSGSSLGRKKQVGTSQENAVTMASKEASPSSGKRAVPAADKEKVKEGEAKPSWPSSGMKQEKVAAQIGQQKTVQEVKKEEEARSTPTFDGSLKKTVQKVKEEGSTRTPIIGGSLEPKVHSKEKVERKRDGGIGQKLKEEGKIGLGENKEKNPTKPAVGDEARRTKEGVERITHEVNENLISKHDKKDEKMVGYKVSEGEIQERVKEKEVEDAGLVKETRDPKGKPEVMEPRRVDSDVKEDLTKGGEEREKMDTPATTQGRGQEEEGSHIYDTSLVNVGVASLVIMGFGAYLFVPLVQMFY